MAFRNLFIGSKAYVRSLHNRIRLEKDDTFLEIPYEDLGAVVIEDRQTTITMHTLKSLAETNTALFVCNDQHLPVGVFLSFQNHSRQVKQIYKQLALNDSFQGRIWKSIIKQKIVNEASVLAEVGKPKVASRLENISRQVYVHDRTNRESYAAAVYFSALFGRDFYRSSENKINFALNYGFSIVRGVIARNIAAFGLLPAVGIHHKNEYNNFNLADDLIEPYRPFVEYFVKLNISYKQDSMLNKNDRATLFDLLNLAVIFNGKEYSLESSIEQMVKSFVTAINDSNTKSLILPEFKAEKRKSYT